MKKICGANMDIDFSKTPGMDWVPGECPKGKDNKCAVKGISICDYFGGIEYPDIVICKFDEKERV